MSDKVRNPVIVHDQNANTLERLRRNAQALWAFITGTVNPAACVCQVDRSTGKKEFMLLEVPDHAKDYILAYDSGDGKFKFVETTDLCPGA